MLETGTSGLMSGEGKPPAASKLWSSALPRLYGEGWFSRCKQQWIGAGERDRIEKILSISLNAGETPLGDRGRVDAAQQPRFPLVTWSVKRHNLNPAWLS